MKDKEKQIEDLTAIINSFNIKTYENAKRVAKFLIEECGYRKIPENARVFIPTDDKYVLLSREEMCELKCQAGEDFNKAYDLGSKKTAEKIYNFAQYFFTWDEEGFVRRLAEYIEQFGVEIME